MESEVMDMIEENVKIDKTIFVKTYTHEEWLRLLQKCHNHAKRIGRSLFVFIVIERTQRCRSMSTKRRSVTKLWIPKGILSS
jgi:hypothetical protein